MCIRLSQTNYSKYILPVKSECSVAVLTNVEYFVRGIPVQDVDANRSQAPQRHGS
jgi:hypothetical protein